MDRTWAIIRDSVVDGGKSRIILATLVTPSEVMDNQPMLDLLWRTRMRRETLAATRDRGQEVWLGRESGGHRRPGHTCLHSHSRCGSPHRVLQYRGIHL